jgi:hypothetical protein
VLERSSGPLKVSVILPVFPQDNCVCASDHVCWSGKEKISVLRRFLSAPADKRNAIRIDGDKRVRLIILGQLLITPEPTIAAEPKESGEYSLLTRILLREWADGAEFKGHAWNLFIVT